MNAGEKPCMPTECPARHPGGLFEMERRMKRPIFSWAPTVADRLDTGLSDVRI